MDIQNFEERYAPKSVDDIVFASDADKELVTDIVSSARPFPAFGKNGIANTMQFAERLLADAHVAVVPGEAFGTDKHVRISYATSMKELERGLDRIHKFIAP